jgi:enamine deaminase RidA (YjgF/YER057c/UK114 family)
VRLKKGTPLADGFKAFQEAWPKDAKSPAVSLSFVSGLANPDYLVEIDAIAVY